MGQPRSDESIRDDVRRRLAEDPHLDATVIEVLVSNREVTLRGTVPNGFAKRAAEEVAYTTMGVTDVVNELRSPSPSERIGTDAHHVEGPTQGAGGEDLIAQERLRNLVGR